MNSLTTLTKLGQWEMIDRFRYRPEIDGLRAVAVLAVMLFHGGFGCPGGYVGVDVFFVISGFLITSLIWKDLESGSFTFAHFWERRARRIVPAMVFVTLATLVAGWFLMRPVDFKALGETSASQAVFGANIYYWNHSGYFSGDAREKPLLHTWSLAVEEQFYFFVPFLLWAMYRAARLRSRAAVLSLISAAFVLSFALSIYGVAHHPRAAFYLLPTRAWELSLGSLVAFLPPDPSMLGRRILREFFSLAGLALILVPVLVYGAETPFPGLAALAPCLGVALLIWANDRAAGNAPTVAGALLATRSLVFIGLISYSLYLWHFPLLAFSHYLALEPISPAQRATMLVLALALSALSWKYVETPFRKRKLAASRKSMFAFVASGLAAVLVCGLLCMATQGFPQRLSSQARDFAAAESDRAINFELTIEEIQPGKLIPLGVSDSTLRPTVMVWGDSHGMAALPAVDAYLNEKGLAGLAATRASAAPVLDWYWSADPASKQHFITYNDAVFRYIQSERIPNVILIARWGRYARKGGHNPGDFYPSLLATVQRLTAIGSRPWIMLDVPIHSFNIPRVLSNPAYSDAYIASHCAQPAAQNELEKNDPEILAELEAAGGRILDPKPRFLDPTGQYYIIQANGIALYWDDNHLTTKGAKLMLVPLFHDSLMLDRPG